ncbi:DUF3772 domain-containing protein [Roseivivax sp. CAU 1753]
MSRLAARCLHAFAILLIWAGAAVAQAPPEGAAASSGTRPEINFEQWDEVASRVEETLAESGAEIATLEELRAKVAAFRDRFNVQQTEQKTRVATLQSQIDALGPPPEEGKTEAQDIANRREELNRQLNAAQAPIVAADEAFTRANGIIKEIDTAIRTRAAERLFRRGPSPFNPTHWTEAADAVVGSMAAFVAETDREIRWDELLEREERLPLAVAMCLFGFVLLARGRAWAERGTSYLRRTTARRGTGVWRFLASLGMIALPLGGIILIALGVQMTGIIGPRAEQVLAKLPVWVGIVVFIRWLALQTFSPDDDEATLPLEAARRTEARYSFGALSFLMILSGLTVLLSRADAYSNGANAVLSFCIVTSASLLLFRLGTIFRRARLENDSGNEDDHDPMHFRLRVARVFGRLLTMTALAAPVASAVGLQRVAQKLTFPMIATMLVAGSILVLLRFVGDLYKLVTGKPPQETNSLIPVFAGVVLILASMPVLALIWGARVSDLTELWATFLNGFEIGDSVISPSDFLSFLAVFLIGFALTRGVQSGLRSAVLPKTKLDIGGQNAIVAGVGYVGIFFAGLLAFFTAGIDLSSLAIVAGALSVGIGFGLQNIVSNFVSGIILLIERPIGEGDWIAVGDNMGFVKDISVRSTRIETFDRFDVIVPNSDLVTGTVTNYTRGNTLGRLIVPVKVAYGSDTRQVHSVLLGIAREHPLVLMNPAPYILFQGFGENGIEFEIRVILTDINEKLEVQTEMYHQIAERFAEEGIAIPIPQRDLWLRNPETLTGQGDADRPGFAADTQSPRDMAGKGPLDRAVARSTGGGKGRDDDGDADGDADADAD